MRGLLHGRARRDPLNPNFKNFYRDLRAAGKPAKVALIAVVRRVATFANALIRDVFTFENAAFP